MRRLVLCALLALTTLLGTQARAETSLTPRGVEAFVASLEEIARLMGLEPWNEVGSGTTVVGGMGGTARFWLVEAGTALDAQRVLARRGFTETGWGETGYRVINAYAALKDGEASASGAMNEEFKQAVLEVENDASLTEEQRGEFIAQMRSSLDKMIKSRAPQGDLAAVRPFLARLDRIIVPDGQ